MSCGQLIRFLYCKSLFMQVRLVYVRYLNEQARSINPRLSFVCQHHSRGALMMLDSASAQEYRFICGLTAAQIACIACIVVQCVYWCRLHIV